MKTDQRDGLQWLCPVSSHLAGLVAFFATVLAVLMCHRASEPNIKSFAIFLSGAGNTLFLTLGYLALVTAGIKARSSTSVKLVLFMPVLVTLTVHVLKLMSGHWLERPSGAASGFPSGHAAASFALAFLLSLRFPKLTVIWYVAAFLISVSRVLTGAHYPYQVAVGAVLGFCLAMFVVEQVKPNAYIESIAYRYQTAFVALPLLAAMSVFIHEIENTLLVLVGTIIFFASGFLLRVWARLSMVSGKDQGRGNFPFVRHPIYIGNTLICIGLTISLEVLWLVPLVLLICATVYSMAVRHEERGCESSVEGTPRRLSHPSWSFLRPLVRAGWTSAILCELPILLLIVPAYVKELIGS